MAKKLSLKTMDEQANEMCSSLPEAKQARAKELAMNLLFLERKLDEARRQALTTPPVSDYDNGGGQSGQRVSPWVQAYGALLKSYGAALKQFEEQFDNDKAKQEEVSPLAVMRNNLTINRAAYKQVKAS